MTVHAATDRPSIDAQMGQDATFIVDVTNSSNVIDAFSVEVFGIDTAWVTAEPARLALFPGERGQVVITVALPANHPSADRTLAINVRSENDPGEFALTDIRLEVAPRRSVTVEVDPNIVTGSRSGVFGLVVRNTGNVLMDIVPFGEDPEALATFAFDPPATILGPDDTAVLRATVSGGRAWFGQIRPRQLALGVAGDPAVSASVVFLQRPRIARWMLSLIGFLLVSLVFALVLDQAFGGIVDTAKIDSRVVEAALSDPLPKGAMIPVRPARIVGILSSSTSDPSRPLPVPGIQVNAFDPGDPLHPVAGAVTDEHGKYEIGGLKDQQPYLLRFSGAGIDPVWYPGSPTAADATAVEATTSPTAAPLPPLQIGGQPGSVAGALTGGDPVGAVAILVVDSDPPVANPPEVARVRVSADGTFSFDQVPAPARYVLIVEQTGYATERRSIHLDAAEELEGIEVALRPGDGQISGVVSAIAADGSGTGAHGGAVIVATDGTHVYRAVSLTDGADVGKFTLRNLPVPGRYTITVQADGFASSTGTIALADDEPQRTFDVTLVPSTGSITGTVRLDDRGASGGITVKVVGPDVDISTTSVSTGAGVGSFLISPVPVPGAYTVTVEREGYLPQVLQVQLTTQQLVGTIDATLVTATGIIRGTVDQVEQGLVGHADVLITDGTTDYHTTTADSPLGAFEIAGLPPGSYTVRAHLVGTTDAVWVVDLSPAEVSELDLHLGIQATIAGQVVRPNADGVAVGVPNAQVRLIPIGDFPNTTANARSACTDADGRFSFTALEGGQTFVVAVYQSSAVAAGGALDSQQVSAVNGARVDVARQLVVTEPTLTCDVGSTSTPTTTVAP